MIITAEVLDRPKITFTSRPTNYSEISPVKRAISPPLHDKKKKAKTATEIMPCPQSLILNSNNTIPSQVTTASIFLSPPGDDSNNVTKLKCDPYVITATITSPHIRVHPSLRRRGSNYKIKEKGTSKETEDLLNKFNASTFSKNFLKNEPAEMCRTEGNPVHPSLAREKRKFLLSSSVTAKENTQPDGGGNTEGSLNKTRKTSNIFLRLGGSRRNSDETTNLKSRPTILGSNSSSQDSQIRPNLDEDTSVPFQKSHPLRHTLGTTRVIYRSRPGPSQLVRGAKSPSRSSPISTRTNLQKDSSKVGGPQGTSSVSASSTASSNLNDLAVLNRLRNEYNKNKDKDNITEEPVRSRNNSISGTWLRVRNDPQTSGINSTSKRPSISVLQNNVAFVNELRSRNNSLTNGELRTRNNSLTSVVNYRDGSRNNSITETSATSFTNKQPPAARPCPKVPNTAAANPTHVAGKITPGSTAGRGRRGKSPSAKVVAKRANKRMGKTVTSTQTRTFQKNGQWFEETVETTVVENNDGSRTTTKTTTKQLPGPPSSAGSQRARSSSSSSSSRSPSPQRAVKKKDSSTGGGLFSRFRTKKDSSSSDDDQDDFDKTFSRDVLEAINEKRSKHGVKGLKMSSKLTHEARLWAKHLASKDKMQHKQDQQFGENIYRLSANLPVDKTVASGKQIVDQWYSEADKHKFAQEPSGAKLETGHFTQIVWKDSKELGVGIALSDTKRNIYVVAFFSPKGNWMGEFATKVPPVGGFPPSSAKKGGQVDKISKAAVGSSSSSEEDEDFNEAVLKAHNQYRSKHGVPPLKLSKKLNKFAEEWATKIAKRDRMEHRSNNDYGENLYAKWNSKPNHTIPGKEAVESWYSEIEDHTFGKEPTSLASGHFTQVVWEDSKELGVGVARNKTSGKLYVVCNYEPAGNMVGSFAKKVPPPKK